MPDVNQEEIIEAIKAEVDKRETEELAGELKSLKRDFEFEKDAIIRTEAWREKAIDCPARYGTRCNLCGDACQIKTCFGLHWTTPRRTT